MSRKQVQPLEKLGRCLKQTNYSQEDGAAALEIGIQNMAYFVLYFIYAAAFVMN